MAQTTSGMSYAAAYLGHSTDGAAWTEISGHQVSIEISGGERSTGVVYTTDGDTGIIKAGKRAPLMVTANVVYTETADEPYDESNDAYEGGSDYYLRWSPGGGAASDLGYTTSAGIVKQAVYPVGDAESGEPIVVSIVLECASVTESTIGTAGW